MSAHTPPMDPNSSEATQPQLDRAKAEGDAYREALRYMAEEVAKDGGTQPAGDYIVGYAVEDAEGMYDFADGSLTWVNPDDENVHLEIVACDAADGRFVPCLNVTATLVSPSGETFGPHDQMLVWHPMLYHYARNWTLPEDGEYTLKVHIDPPTFMRHDEINGRRFTEPVDVEFTGVKIKRGAEPVEPPQ
ncbi:Fe2+ transport protein [Paramicrobacterium agarici]|uniref:Fe2+ transport protein n=2 Tax=Paramicrobacterium agarici TaxID=630514 RepID=A0A2A9DSL0_9MICO|nr:Fe2+ transport protein [Microbacterium agarici]